jgi:hypothetical protein
MYCRERLKAGILSILVSGLLSLFPLTAPTAWAEDAQQAGVSEDASAALARMSKTLQAKEFSFRSRTFRGRSRAPSATCWDREFADSPLEQRRFELSVHP